MIDFTCPNCGEELSFDDDTLGTVVLCFACDQALTVPPSGRPAKPAELPLKSPVDKPHGLLPTALWLIGCFVFLGGAAYVFFGITGDSMALVFAGIGAAVGSIVWFALSAAIDDLRHLRQEFETFVAGERQS